MYDIYLRTTTNLYVHQLCRKKCFCSAVISSAPFLFSETNAILSLIDKFQNNSVHTQLRMLSNVHHSLIYIKKDHVSCYLSIPINCGSCTKNIITTLTISAFLSPQAFSPDNIHSISCLILGHWQ
jgi:hypothetical protein